MTLWNIVGGVNARKAGHQLRLGGRELTVFGTVEEAIEDTGADVSVVFVPPRFAKDGVIEAIDAAIPLVVVITEGIPTSPRSRRGHSRHNPQRNRRAGPTAP